jgi:hypothetical protein
MTAAALPLGSPLPGAFGPAPRPSGPMRRATDFAGASGLSPIHVLGPALAEAVLQLVRVELQARATPTTAPARSPWMTPPAASKLTRVPVKTIRSWVQDGRIRKRLKNRSPDPKQLKYLVNVEDVIAAAEAWTGSEAPPAQVNDVKEQARQFLAARAAKGR